MKKEVKVIIAVVLAVWILLMGIEIGALREKKKISAEAATSTTATTTTLPTTTQPVAPVNPNSADPNGGASQPANASTTPSAADTSSTPAVAGDVSTLTKEQIVAKVAESVNKVKSEQNMTCHKIENITVNITELSAEALRSPVNSVVSSIVGDPKDEIITVAGGIATYPDGSTKPVKEAIPPSNEATKDFSLAVDGVANATAAKQGDNTVYTVILIAESTTAANPIPTHNSKAIGFLDLMGLDLPAVTITQADMQYPGSTVEVTVNAAGQVVKLVNKMPMTGAGAAKITLLSGDAKFEGSLDETWEFTY